MTINPDHALTTNDLEQAYLELYPALRSYLQRKVREGDQAEDLAQETFYRALKASQAGTCRLPTTRQECRSWLYRIATNLAIDTQRRGKCLTWCDLDEAYTIAANGPGADPQDLYPHLEEEEAVRATLACLPDHYRLALELYYRSDFVAAQVARRIGMPPSAGKRLLKRARDAFAQQYRKQEEVSA